MKVLLKRTPLKPYIPEWVLCFAFPEPNDEDPPLHCDDLIPYIWPTPRERLSITECISHLSQTGAIIRCLSLKNGEDLIRSGSVPKHFAGHLCLWRSVAYDSAGNMFLPFIQNITGQIPIIYWWWTEYENRDTFLTLVAKK